MSAPWHHLAQAEDIPSPALLIWPDRVRRNIDRMVEVAGSPDRLRPHVKTHKCGAVIRLQLEQGISRFKCATIAEMEMAAGAGARDLLLAIQPTGPHLDRLFELARVFPRVRFSCVVDDRGIMDRLAALAFRVGMDMGVWLDVDAGMHRTGIAPGAEALELYRVLHDHPKLEVRGLHVYDGHLRVPEPEARRAAFDEVMQPVRAFRQRLLDEGLAVPSMAGGGTPTFAFHAASGDTECGPGTTLLWDFGYGDAYPELGMVHAAAVLTRVISKPGGQRLCLDLGSKAVASEMEPPRVRFPDLPDATFGVQSEEHLTVKTSRADDYTVGDALIGIPRHICPTVARYEEAVVIREGRPAESWRIEARVRRMSM